MVKQEKLKEKRQYFHQLLLALGEERYKEVIVEAQFGVSSTKDLNIEQLDSLIADAKNRLHNSDSYRSQPLDPESSKMLRMWRNKCLLVMNERGITATPKDWTAVNQELEKKQYQWVLSPAQLAKGLINHKGLYAFRKVGDLKKLFKQLCSIRDNEKTKDKQLKELSIKN